MKKLIVTIMGDNGNKFIDMCFKSVINADKIIFCWGEEDIKTKEKYLEYQKKYPEKFELISTFYNQEDKAQNGRTRNFYLNYLKNNYPEDWNLCLDLDEIVEDLDKIKALINNSELKGGIVSIKMRHLIGDFAHEDATVNTHYVLNRLFKISDAKEYPLVEHPVLKPNEGVKTYTTDITTIWHLAYVPNMWDIKKRFECHTKKSNMHSPEYLHQWYFAHLFGTYPKREFNPVELPIQLLNEFGIKRDELYFNNRNIETKHFIDAINWRDYFKPESVLEIGAGLGVRTYAMTNVGLKVLGTEISEYAVYNSIKGTTIVNDDIINTKLPLRNNFDLVVCYDVLEHIEEKDLDKAINNIITLCKKHILVSVPVIGDPNLNNDKSHKSFKTMDEWKKLFIDKGCVEVEVPNNFLYRNQTFIMRVKCQ